MKRTPLVVVLRVARHIIELASAREPDTEVENRYSDTAPLIGTGSRRRLHQCVLTAEGYPRAPDEKTHQ
jgi:hypothetical protein